MKHLITIEEHDLTDIPPDITIREQRIVDLPAKKMNVYTKAFDASLGTLGGSDTMFTISCIPLNKVKSWTEKEMVAYIDKLVEDFDDADDLPDETTC